MKDEAPVVDVGADGAWVGGSDAHVEAEHGPWSDRKAAAFQARWEWLPARPPDVGDPSRVFRSVRIGELAEIFLDAGGNGAVADIGVDFDEEVAADDHWLQLRMVDVGGNDGAARCHLLPHKLSRDGLGNPLRKPSCHRRCVLW